MKAIPRLGGSTFEGRDGETQPMQGVFGRVVLVVTLLAIGLSRFAAAQTQEPCGASALCLGDGRYQFLAFWDDPDSGDQHVAQPVSLTSGSGYFWFFNPTNIEITVKVVDGCSVNGHEWVFISGMTNLAVRIAVTDVLSTVHETYTNSQGVAFQPIQDTATFSNCPSKAGGAIAGTWTGTFDSADFVDCDSNTPAEVSLTQEGSAVTGTLSAPTNFCGPHNAQLAGTLQGNTLTGAVTGFDVGRGPYTNAHVFGTLAGTSLELTIVNGFGLIPGGTLHLHR